MTAQLKAQYQAMLGEFRNEGLDTSPIESWTDVVDQLVCRNRQQMVVALPVFALLLVEFPDVPIYMEIAALVDRGDSLIEPLSSSFCISKGHIRFLNRKGPAIVGAEWLRFPDELVEAIAIVKIDNLPRSRSDWIVFGEFWRGCRGLVADSDDTDWRHWMSRCSLDVMRTYVLNELCAKSYAASARKLNRLLNRNIRQLASLRDYIKFVEQWCKGQAIKTGILQVGRHAYESIGTDFLMRYSAIKLIEQSCRWHREIFQADRDPLEAAFFETVCQFDCQILDWPPLPCMPMRIGAIIVHSLTDVYQLKDEGRQLEHCVGQYFYLCVLGDSHIISLRNADGVALSTAEIRVFVDSELGLTVQAVQHQAQGNGEPKGDCVTALSATLLHLNDERTQPALRDLLRFHENRRQTIPVRIGPDFGWFDRDFYTELMQRILPDFDNAVMWLEERIDEIRGLSLHRNELIGERMSQLGFGDELTEDRAMEIFRDTGNSEIWDIPDVT